MAEPPTTENATDPVGVVPEPSVTVTCAVMVTFCPVEAGFGVADSDTAVGCAVGVLAPVDHVLPSADQLMNTFTEFCPAPLPPAKHCSTTSWLPPAPMSPPSRMADRLMLLSRVPLNAAATPLLNAETLYVVWSELTARKIPDPWNPLGQAGALY